MPDDVATLLNRIDAEFSALDAKIKAAQGEKQQEHRDRQTRLATFEKELETLLIGFLEALEKEQRLELGKEPR